MFYQQKCMKKLCIFAVPVREDGVDLSDSMVQVGRYENVPVREDGVDLSKKYSKEPKTIIWSPSARTGWI